MARYWIDLFAAKRNRFSFSLSLFVRSRKEEKERKIIGKGKKRGRRERELCEIWRSMSRKMKSWVRVKDEID